MGQSPNTHLAAKELSLHKPGPIFSARLFVASVLALALALPAAAAAQDPSVDQYTPTAPDGGGSVPIAPVPNSDGGGGSSPPPETSGGGGGSEADAAPADTSVAPATTQTDTTAAPVQTSGGSGKDEKPEGNKDSRTLDGFAANAAAQRDAVSSPRYEQAATQLLRSDSGSQGGMGIFLWVVVVATGLWAVATLVVRRRHDGDGHPA